MHSMCVSNMIKQSKPLQTRYNVTYVYIYIYIYTTGIISERMYICSFLVWKNACLNYRVFDPDGNLMGYPIHGMYRPSLSKPYLNLLEESRTWWLWLSGKRNVSVCRGHELANALYADRPKSKCRVWKETLTSMALHCVHRLLQSPKWISGVLSEIYLDLSELPRKYPCRRWQPLWGIVGIP